MKAGEPLQTGYQPQRGKPGRGRERELATDVGCAQLVGRGLQALEHVGGDAVEGVATFGQRQRALPPLEQRHAEVVLERLDLPADGGLGDEELLGRLGEA